MQQLPPSNQAIPLPANNDDILANSYINRFEKDLASSINKLGEDMSEGFSWNQISAHFQKFKDNLNEVFGGNAAQNVNVPPAPAHIRVLESDPVQPGALTHPYRPEDSFDMIKPLKSVDPSDFQLARSDQTLNTSQAHDQEFDADSEKRVFLKPQDADVQLI